MWPRKCGAKTMAGTRDGGLKTAQTNKERYGKDWYCIIGAKGGKNGTTGGFYANRELASEAGRKGGRISRRPKAQK
jgi:general stress protein YciG